MGAQSVTNFVGISMGAINDRLCVIATSQGVSVIKPEGLTTRECIAFLWTIGARDQRSEVRGQKEKPAVALVCYNASVDFEMLLRDLSPWDKDKLFGIWRTKEDNNKDLPIYDAGRGAESVDFEGFRLYQLPGKLMRLSIPRRRGMVIFDIASYFDSAEIGEAAKEYLDAETRRRGAKSGRKESDGALARWSA